MKLAFCNELFRNWEVDRMAQFLADAGYSGIELAPWTFTSFPRGYRDGERLAAAVREAGLEIVGLHWLFGEEAGYHIHTLDTVVRERTWGRFLELLELCADLGGRRIIFGSPKQRIVEDGESHEHAWRTTQELFLRGLEIAERRDLILCIEPLSSDQTNFINTVADALRFVREIRHRRMTMMVDVYSLTREKGPISDLIEAAGTNLEHFHADDANGRGPGGGDTDFVAIGEALRRVGYAGYVSVEIHDLTVDPGTTALRSIRTLTESFKST